MELIFHNSASDGGIYKIVNTNNLKIYIGSTKCFKKRALQHSNALNKNKHTNRKLQFSYNKHKAGAFMFEVVEVLHGTTEHIRTIEEMYIRQYFDNGKQCYNIKEKTTKKDKKYYSFNPEETRRKIGKASKEAWKQNPTRRMEMSIRLKKVWKNEDYRKKMNILRTGQRRTEETKRKLSDQKIGKKNPMFGRVFSIQHRERMSTSRRGKALGPMLEETKVKISASRRGKGCYPCSDEKKRKLSIANKGKKPSKKSIQRTKEVNSREYNLVLISPSGIEIMLYRNAAAFCRKYKLSKAGINKLLNGKIKFYKGWALKTL